MGSACPATLPAVHFKRRTVARLARFLDYVTIKVPGCFSAPR